MPKVKNVVGTKEKTSKKEKRTAEEAIQEASSKKRKGNTIYLKRTKEKQEKKKEESDLSDNDFDALQEEAKTPVTDQSSTRRLFVSNLCFNTDKKDVFKFFKEAGEVISVDFATYRHGSFRGFGHVEFATDEAVQNALKMNGQELNGRKLTIEIAHARGRGAPAPDTGKDINQNTRAQKQTVIVAGFDKSLPEFEIRSSLEKHFSSCGKIARISIPQDNESSSIKGFAYIEFKEPEGFSKALMLDGSDISSHSLVVHEARPRGNKNVDRLSSRDGVQGAGDRVGRRDNTANKGEKAEVRDN